MTQVRRCNSAWHASYSLMLYYSVETDKLLGWASEAFSALSSTSTSVSFYWIDKAELLLSSSATALFAVNQQPSRIQNPELRAKCRDILISLNELISIEQGRIRSLALMSQEWSSDGVQYITVSAFVSICQSLVAFALRGRNDHVIGLSTP